MSRLKFFPGWKMTIWQHGSYFKLLTAAYRSQGKVTAAEREELRQTIHLRAFGHPVSAKEIDHLKMFDAFKAECLASSQPANLDAQMRQVDMPLIRLRHAIRALADAPYWQRISQDKFGTTDLESLNEDQLTQLRNTLSARKPAQCDDDPY